MAAPTVRGVGAFGSGTTSFVAPVPTAGAAPAAGDAMYIVMESTDSTTAAGTPNTPNGWAKLFENTIAAGSSVEPAVSTLTIFGKIAGASEGDVTVDGVGNHCAGAMIVIAGHGLSVIADTVVGSAADHGASTTNILAPSINITANSLVLTCMGLGDDANDTTNVSGVTNANLASITEQVDRTVSTGSGGGVGIYTSTCAGTSTGATEWDHDTAASSQSVQLGIKPPASTTTPVSITATSVASAVVSRAATHPRALAATAIGTTAVAQSVISRVIISALALGASLMSASPSFAIALAAAAPGVARIARRFSFILAATAAGVPAVVRGIGKTLAATAAGIAVVSSALIMRKTVSAAATGAATLAANFEAWKDVTAAVYRTCASVRQMMGGRR